MINKNITTFSISGVNKNLNQPSPVITEPRVGGVVDKLEIYN